VTHQSFVLAARRERATKWLKKRVFSVLYPKKASILLDLSEMYLFQAGLHFHALQLGAVV
jgi:hypothetical protein